MNVIDCDWNIAIKVKFEMAVFDCGLDAITDGLFVTCETNELSKGHSNNT